VVANCDHLDKLKYSNSLPYAFTEHGAIMAASVLNTPRAIEVSVFIVRAFIKLRQIIAGQKELQHKISQIERRLADHDDQIIELVSAIKQLLKPDPPPKKSALVFILKNTNIGLDNMCGKNVRTNVSPGVICL